MKYDVFISYRRDGGSHAALTLYNSLVSKGYRVFYDVRTLGSGEFDTALLRVISECTDFLLILSPGALDRCANEDDWVRREIDCAMRCGKNIIPIMTQRFTFPENLPEEIAKLPFHNGLDASTTFYDAFIKKLRTFMKSRPSPLQMLLHPTRHLALAGGVLLCTACLCFGGAKLYNHMTAFPHNAAQRSVLSESLSYLTFNLTYADGAIKAYNNALNDCLKYLRGSSTLTRESLQLSLDHAMDTAALAYSEVLTLSDSLSERLDDTPLSKADVTMQPTAIRLVLSELYNQLDYLSSTLIDDTMLMPATKETYVEGCLELASVNADLLFYSLNELLLPVDGAALTELQTKQLPTMTTVYGGKKWIDSASELEGIQETLMNLYSEVILRLSASGGAEQQKTDEMLLLYNQQAAQ